jgi:hypothetical protein
MRPPVIISLVGLTAALAASVPAAAAATKHLEYGMEQYWCRQMQDERKFARSLTMCQDALDDAKRNATASQSWLSYDGESQALEMIAIDDSALGHHKAAYKAAVQGHQLSYYLVKYFVLDPDDKVTIGERIDRFVAIESTEAAYMRRGIGD